jgi:subtilisin family serine protease
VDEFGDYAFFSSVGPSADGQVKPDVASRGFDAWLISGGGNLVPGSGTSFSSPLMAGAIACLVQANPTMTAQQVMDAVRQSANQFTTPDEFLGYGIPNFCNANDILSSGVGIADLNAEEIRVYPVPANDFFVIDGFNPDASDVDITLYNAMGARILLNNIQVQNGKARLDVSDLSAGVYTLEVMDSKNVLMTRKRVLIAK